MAGKGGGAWKVAYADFVTAMMAFFLVMWLVTQDKKVKEAVARYFTDPVGFYQIGSTKNPSVSGAMFDSEVHGQVPGKKYQISGSGRGAHVDRGQGEVETTAVTDWIHSNPDQAAYWAQQAQRQREAASQSQMVKDKVITVEEATRIQLAKQIEREMLDQLPVEIDPLYRELVKTSMEYVDWRSVADHCLSRK
ncbi:Motility protein B [Caulifigura coniformis]|uniref:Motility protein B n=1 Tax=Caulifigura coniformis TaxID=2527983 RepID=A0A517SJ97_9PLAN|nr:flagellar motor protein MotB [Caulifigura coniformis]QDT56203.1 Motility protein B [Caulifigura coniformis]